MVDFNPDYLAKHPEVALDRPAFKAFLVDLAKLAKGDCSGSWVQVTRWRKCWLTKDAKLRKELIDCAKVRLFVDGTPMLEARLRDLPGRAWTPIPAPVSGAQLVLHSSAQMAIALVTNPPCTLDPRPLVKIEIRCAPFKKEK